MFSLAHPETLGIDWLPPVALRRRADVETVVRALRPVAVGAPVRLAAVVGPAGSGTSTVARLAARAAREELRSLGCEAPVVAAVRVPVCRGATGVAAGCLRALDPGFTGRGFTALEILAGFLRRLRRARRAAVLVIDDLSAGAPDLSPLFSALADPDRFLPEGEAGLPPIAAIFAGRPEAIGVWRRLDHLRRSPVARIELAPYPTEAVVEILLDRAHRALGRDPPPHWAEELRRHVVGRTLGLAPGFDHLRRQLAAPRVPPAVSGAGPSTHSPGVEPRLLVALSRAASDRRATIAEIRRCEEELAVAEGARPLPATTFWRRIVQLESVGVVHREVRTGGPGGTRSIVELLRPVTDPAIPRGTLPSDGGRLALPAGGPSWGRAR